MWKVSGGKKKQKIILGGSWYKSTYNVTPFTHTHPHLTTTCTALPSSTTMTDNYNTNFTMVYNNESIDSIKPNEELLNFADIAWNIQNRASCCVGLELKEARLFREFFGTSKRVVEILWELVVCNKLRPRGGAWSICSERFIL
jgi:hypothetical protein